MRVLYVTPAARHVTAITTPLAEAEFACETTADADDAFELAKGPPPFDAILLDQVPRDALAWLRRVRNSKIKTPVIVLSTHQDIAWKIASLNTGADDFLALPCDPGELVARLHAVIRRSVGYAQSVVRIGPLVISLTRRAVLVAGRPVHLAPNEYKLLELLAMRLRGRPVSKDDYLTHAYAPNDDEPAGKILDVMVCKLRKKLRDAGAPDCIVTEWGSGYRLTAPAAPPTPLPPPRNPVRHPEFAASPP
jgi:two-component system cell cycle response regulator CtrA